MRKVTRGEMRGQSSHEGKEDLEHQLERKKETCASLGRNPHVKISTLGLSAKWKNGNELRGKVPSEENEKKL